MTRYRITEDDLERTLREMRAYSNRKRGKRNLNVAARALDVAMGHGRQVTVTLGDNSEVSGPVTRCVVDPKLPEPQSPEESWERSTLVYTIGDRRVRLIDVSGIKVATA